MIYTINTISVLGDKDETYGYTYWGHVHEADYPVRFSSHQVIDDIKDKGRKIVSESQAVKQGKKGEYLQLYKVKLDTDSSSLKERWDEVTSGSQGGPPMPDTQTQVPRKPVAAALYNPNYAKDLTDMPVRLYTANLNYAKDIGLNLVDNPEDRRKYYEYIQDITEELLTWIQNIRSGESLKSEEISNEPN
jgi:hypothetical protein